MKQIIYILAFLAIGNTYAQSNIKVGEQAPKINITDWIENVPNDKNLSNKYIVLEFWATWCGPCIAAVPHMNNLQNKFNQRDLYFISITDESIAKVERSLKRIKFNSIVVTDLTKKTQINFGDGVKGLDTYPLTVLIDKNGIIKWIGEPKKLNAEIMSSFLSNSDATGSGLTSEDNITPQNTKDTLTFYDLLRKKEISYYFHLQETTSENTSKQAMGTSIISLKSYSLEDIYNDIFKIKKARIKLPEGVGHKKYDLLYKNSEEPENLSMLENELLSKLNLKKQTETKPTKVNFISIGDKSLLEETLEKEFSAKSDADDKIIFTAYTINGVLEELSHVSSEEYKFNGTDETKYDFIIEIGSKSNIINSLKSYGLTVEEKDVETEYVTLREKE